MTTSLKTDAQNSTILQKTFGKTITLEGFTVNKSFFVKNVLNSHTDMIKEIYDTEKNERINGMVDKEDILKKEEVLNNQNITE